ncbi:MAG: NAD(P)/FAD-dependent oxidoreductase [Ardenticatenales bacterium]
MTDHQHDVAIIGGGIAALSAAIFLRRAGLNVACVESVPYPHHRVGESLDWSSPWLLEQLGVAPDGLIDDGVATPKHHIVVNEIGRAAWQARPWPFLTLRPMRFATSTLHVDRTALDQRLYERACALGTTFIWERATEVDVDGDRVTAVTTASGRRITARWYIDATGTVGLFGKTLAVPRTYYGEPKVALWTYFDTPPSTLGTTFFVDNANRYLHWVWDIPISPVRASVGLVLTAEAMKSRRHGGASVRDILRTELGRFERFDALLRDQPDAEVVATSFQPYVSRRSCGANWLMVGEAASMPDPLTGNGVTSAMRHARYAAAVIAKAGAEAAIPARQRRRYEAHVRRLGHAFNRSIERAVYQPEIRWGLGLLPATMVYTVFGFFSNALYARFDPQGPIGMAAFGVLFGLVRFWIDGWSLAGRAMLRLRGAAARPSAAVVVA